MVVQFFFKNKRKHEKYAGRKELILFLFKINSDMEVFWAFYPPMVVRYRGGILKPRKHPNPGMPTRGA